LSQHRRGRNHELKQKGEEESVFHNRGYRHVQTWSGDSAPVAGGCQARSKGAAPLTSWLENDLDARIGPPKGLALACPNRLSSISCRASLPEHRLCGRF